MIWLVYSKDTKITSYLIFPGFTSSIAANLYSRGYNKHCLAWSLDYCWCWRNIDWPRFSIVAWTRLTIVDWLVFSIKVVFSNSNGVCWLHIFILSILKANRYLRDYGLGPGRWFCCNNCEKLAKAACGNIVESGCRFKLKV